MTPIYCTWEGDVLRPMQRHLRICDKQFVVGQMYPIVIEEPRSRASHNHFFASIEEAWRNLPEEIAAEFPSSEHLRKYALIKAGFCDKRSHVCTNDVEARRFAAFIKPIDEFAIIDTTDNVVTIYTAQSQSVKAMGAKAFQQSKTSVLEIISALIGVDPATLSSETGRAA